MTITADVPAIYRTQWNSKTTNTPPELGLLDPKSNDMPDSTLRKLNTSCMNCRKSRVKCSGGNPCNRCATSPHALNCEYGVSRRCGKRKARDSRSSHTLRPIEPAQTGMQGYTIASDHVSDVNVPMPLDWSVQDEPIVWNEFEFSGMEDGSLGQPALAPNHMSSPGLTEFLNTMESPTRPRVAVRADGGTCSNGCFISVHAVTNKLASSRNTTGHARFDIMLSLLDESIAHATKYLACVTCDAGCPRLMTLSLLHQRQIDSLADFAKNPGLCVSNESPRIAFGEYVPLAEDDINCKKVVLLRVARDIAQSLNSFHGGARDFEERYIEGTLELGEAGQLNLNWLLSIAVTLKRRVDCVKILLQKPDWAASV